MRDIKKTASCWWSYRKEVLGLVLIFTATVLTLVTLNSVGIAAMFVVGLLLLCHKHLHCSSSEVCHTDCHGDTEDGKKPTKKVMKA